MGTLPPGPPSALVSARFEALCLRLLAGLSIPLAVAAIFCNEFFPLFLPQVSRLLEGPIVDLDSLPESFWRPAYQWVNRAEGLIWLILAGLVYRRFAKSQKSEVEPLYALAFLLFGISDFIEAVEYPAWLGIWKVENLLVLLYCRSYLLRVHYVDSKVY